MRYSPPPTVNTSIIARAPSARNQGRKPCADKAREKFRDAAIPGAMRVCRRSEEHTSELQSLMRISYAVFCLKKKTKHQNQPKTHISDDQKHQQQLSDDVEHTTHRY